MFYQNKNNLNKSDTCVVYTPKEVLPGVESGLTYNFLNPTTVSDRAEVVCRWRQVQLSAVGFKSIH